MKPCVALGVSDTPNEQRIPSSPVPRLLGIFLSFYFGFDPTGTFTGTCLLWLHHPIDNQQVKDGGRGGIRTHVRIAPKPDFESGAFNHSATLPFEANRPGRRAFRKDEYICIRGTGKQISLAEPDGASGVPTLCANRP